MTSNRGMNRSESQPFTNRNLSSPVILHVYDMSWVNEYISNLGLGIYHTGVEIYSREYCYGGHQLGGSGIFEMLPKDSANLGLNYSFKVSIEVGTTDFTSDDVRVILNTMETDFCGDQYHLLRKNCNHFSQAFIEILCGATIPKWINRLALMSTKLPFIERSLPREWLSPLDECPSTSVETNPSVHEKNRTTIVQSRIISRNRDLKSILRHGETPSKITSSHSSVSDESLANKDSGASLSKSSETWRRISSNFYNYFQRQESSRSRNSLTDSTDRSSSCNSSISSFSKLPQTSPFSKLSPISLFPKQSSTSSSNSIPIHSNNKSQ